MRTTTDLQRDILAELAWEPSMDAGSIGVAVHEGVVTLSGHVKSYADKQVATRAAKRVAGVKGIANDLEVRLLPSTRRDDTDIAAAAVHALGWNSLVPGGRITVVVEEGWVTLEGDVDWQFERKAAEREITSLTGVLGVTNRITVKPRVAAEQVDEAIRRAFERHAELDADRLHVEVVGSRVTLRGSVESWSEYEQAEWAAWSAPGVSEVKNQLQVEARSPALA